MNSLICLSCYQFANTTLLDGPALKLTPPMELGPFEIVIKGTPSLTPYGKSFLESFMDQPPRCDWENAVREGRASG